MQILLPLLFLIGLAQSWAVFANSLQELPHNQLLYNGHPVQYQPAAVHHQNIVTTTVGETQQQPPTQPQYYPQLAQTEQPQAISTHQQYPNFAKLGITSPQTQHNPGNVEMTVIKPSMFSSTYYYGPGQLKGVPSQSNLVPIGVQNSPVIPAINPEQYEVHVLDSDGIYQQFYQTSLEQAAPSRKSQFIAAETTTTTPSTTSTPAPSNVPPRKSQLAFIIPEMTTPKPTDPNQSSNRNNTVPSEKYLPPFKVLTDAESDLQMPQQVADQITSESATAQSSVSRYHGPDYEYLPVTTTDSKRTTILPLHTTQSQETGYETHSNSQHSTTTLRPSTGHHGYRYNTPAQRHPSPHAKTINGVNYNELGMSLNISTETQQILESGSEVEEKTEIETQQGYAYGQPADSGGQPITHLKPVSTIPNSYHYYRPQQEFEESYLGQQVHKNQTRQQYERPTGSTDSLHYGYQSTSSVYPNSSGNRETNYGLPQTQAENDRRPATQQSPSDSVPNGLQNDRNTYPNRFDDKKIQHGYNPSQIKQNLNETSRPASEMTTPHHLLPFGGNYRPESRPFSDNPYTVSGNVYQPTYPNNNVEPSLQPETGENSAFESSKPQPTLSAYRPGGSSEQESTKPQSTLSHYRPGGSSEQESFKRQPTLSPYKPGSLELNVNYNPHHTHTETTGIFRPSSDSFPGEIPLYERGDSKLDFKPNLYPNRPEGADHHQNFNSKPSHVQERPSSQLGEYEKPSRPIQRPNRPESAEGNELIQQRPSAQYEQSSRPIQHSNRPGSGEGNESIQQRPSAQYEQSSRPIQRPNIPGSEEYNETAQKRPPPLPAQYEQPSRTIEYPNRPGNGAANEHYNSSSSETFPQHKLLSETGQYGQYFNPTIDSNRPGNGEINVNLPSSPNLQQLPTGNFQPSLEQYKLSADRERYEQQPRPTLNPGQFNNDQAAGNSQPSQLRPSWGSAEYDPSLQQPRPTLNPGPSGNGQFNNDQATGNTGPAQQRPSWGSKEYEPSTDRKQYEQQTRPTLKPGSSVSGQFNSGQANRITGQRPSLGPKDYDASSQQQGNTYNPIQQYIPALDNSKTTLPTNNPGSKDSVQQVYPFTNFRPIGSDDTSTNSQHPTSQEAQLLGDKGKTSSLPLPSYTSQNQNSWNQNLQLQTQNPLSSNPQTQQEPAKVITLPLGLLPPIVNATGLSDSSLARPVQDSKSYPNSQSFNTSPESQTQVQRFPNTNQVSPLTHFPLSSNQGNLEQSLSSSNEAFNSPNKEQTSLSNNELVNFPLNRGNLHQLLSSAQKTITSGIDQPQRTGDIYSQVSHSVGDPVSQGLLQLQGNSVQNSLSEANSGYRQPRLPQKSFSTGIGNQPHQGQLPQSASSSSFNPHYSSTGWLPIQPSNPKVNHPTFQHQPDINGNALLTTNTQRVKPLQQQLTSPSFQNIFSDHDYQQRLPLAPTAAQESSGTLSAETEYQKLLTNPKQFSQPMGTHENSQLFLAKPTKTSPAHSADPVSNFFSPSGSLSNTAPSTSANKGHFDLSKPFNGQSQSLASVANANLLQMPSHSYSYTMHPGHLNHVGQSTSVRNLNSKAEGRPISKPMIFVETPESATTAAPASKPMVFTEASTTGQQQSMIQPRSMYGASIREPSNIYLPHSVMSGSPYHNKK